MTSNTTFDEESSLLSDNSIPSSTKTQSGYSAAKIIVSVTIALALMGIGLYIGNKQQTKLAMEMSQIYSTEKGVICQGFDMSPGQNIPSADGAYRLSFQEDGNLVIYSDGEVPIKSWDTYHEPRGVRLYYQPDGNLVIYNSDGDASWSSGTDGSTPSVLIMQNDGNLVMYNPHGGSIWSSDTYQSDTKSPNIEVADAWNICPTGPTNDPTPNPTPKPTVGIVDTADILNGVLCKGTIIEKGTEVWSKAKTFKLSFASNGDLNVEDYGGKRIKSFGTSGADTAELDVSGDFKVYRKEFQSSTGQTIPRKTYLDAKISRFVKEDVLVMQDDGNVVIYDNNAIAYWSSNSQQVGLSNSISPAEAAVQCNLPNPDPTTEPSAAPTNSPGIRRNGVICQGSTWLVGEDIYSENRRFRLQLTPTSLRIMDGENQLKEIDNDRGWEKFAKSFFNEDLVIVDVNGNEIWSTSERRSHNGESGKYLVMQNDGNLVIYAPSSDPVWSSESNVEGLSNTLDFWSDVAGSC